MYIKKDKYGRDILYPEEGYVLEEKARHLQFNSVELNNINSPEDYVEVKPSLHNISDEVKIEKDKEIQRHINDYLKYKEKIEELDLSSFKTKSQQKEALELISRAFEELADADQTGLIIPMWELKNEGNYKEYDKLQNIYYNYASNPYQFTEKKQALIKDYCPHFDDLLELRELWLKTKEAPVEPRKTKEETTKEKQELRLKTIDYSRITNQYEWNDQINKLMLQVEKLITPVYEEIKKQMIAKKPNQAEEIEKMIDTARDADLWDTRIKVMKALNFDIQNIELRSYNSDYKSWIINGNILLKIETIQAGGYNIQRLHNRTLVKVKQL